MFAVYYIPFKGNCMRRIILALVFCALTTPVWSQSPSPADQVKIIQDDPRVKAAFDHIDKDRDAILREWIAITEINAPSKHERERAKYLESCCVNLNWTFVTTRPAT